MHDQPSSFPRWDFFTVLIIALVARVLLLLSGSVSFHADEGIVALMARHITQGENMVFFYGQPYMGSLNAYIIALGYRLLGESVQTIRITQFILLLVAVGTAYWAAWHLTRNRLVAFVGGLSLAVPPVIGALYTTVSIGGYVETLIFGNLLLILTYDLAREHSLSVWRWALLGFIAGLAWWTNNLIVMYLIPIGVLLIIRAVRMESRRGQVIGLMGVALVMFFVGGLPWWVFNFRHENAALAFLVPGIEPPEEFATIGIVPVPAWQRTFLLFLFGLPAAVGLRFPWSGEYFLPIVGLIVLVVYIVAFYLMGRRKQFAFATRFLVYGTVLTFVIVFIASSFGTDPTGRYFVVLLLPFAVAFGGMLSNLMDVQRIAAIAVLVVVVGYYALGQVVAALNNPPGLTTQFDLISHFPNDDDDELLAFLLENELYHGYTNYWIATRMAFLSGEQLQYSSALPYKEDLSYNPADNRYKPYQVAAEAATQGAYINTDLLPELDEVLVDQFDELGILYETAEVGIYNIYYNFESEIPMIAFENVIVESRETDDSTN